MSSDTNNITIEDLEYAVVAKNFLRAEEVLMSLVQLYVKNKVELAAAPFDRELTKEQKDLESYQIIEKLATLITTWFSDWNYTPSDRIYSFICLQKMFIGNLFSASSYHSTDHILKNLALIGKTEYSPLELQRMLFVLTNESSLEIPWKVMFQHLPEQSIQAYSGLVRSINIQLSERSKNSIMRLVEASSYAPIVNSSNFANLSPLLSTYFNCSNLNNPNKYEVKKWVVKTIENLVPKLLSPGLMKRLHSEVKVKPNTENTTVLFVHESYTSEHAMYRCWHKLFSSVKKKYHSVGICFDKKINTEASVDFNEFHTFDNQWDIERIVKKILKIKPDIIVYPSIGMSGYAPFLAGLRLAPIQIACPGHPSSSYMSNIDYFFMSREGLNDDEMGKILQEKWLKCPDGVGQMVLLKTDLPKNKNKAEIFDIAVNGVIQKVTFELVQLCKRVSQEANINIRFHFFMASPKQDIEYFSAKSILRRFLPNSEIHSFSNYSNYLSILNLCEFAIPTIPFGGSNSNIDLIRVGVPKLFIQDKNDLSGLTDLQLWQEVGELHGFCQSIEELEIKAIELINSPSELNNFKEKIKAIDLHSLDISSESDKEDNRFLDALTSVLENNK